jgi:large subunit ribosomal protein L29
MYMVTRELRQMSDQQLEDTLRATYRQIFQLRFRAATEKLGSPGELRKLRRTIARVKTLQRERQLRTQP